MKNQSIIISPSILSADFNCLEKQLTILKTAGIKWLHFDVMDGNFVSNITFGPKILTDLKKHHDFIYDCHLMVINPDKQILKFAAAGANLITIHFEAMNFEEVIPTLTFIRERGCRVGLSIKPKTRVKLIYEYLEYIDLLLVMSVAPGAGGQEFIPKTLKKIVELKNYRDKMPLLNFLISVDGGINQATACLCKDAGADVLVSGSYIFNAIDIKSAISLIQ